MPPSLPSLSPRFAAVVLAACATGATDVPAAPTAPPTFNPGDAASSAPESPVTITVEPDGSGVAQPLLTAIEGARTAVHVEMYLLTSDVYLQALGGLASRGVDVKVVLNRSFPSGTYETNAQAYATLAAAGVGVRWAPTDTGFPSYTHAKSVIVDPGTAGASAWIMTMNLDASAPRDNREFLARDTAAADVAEAEAIFQADYAGLPITPTGWLVVAPSPQDDAASALETLVMSAGRTLDIEAEELDDAGLEASLFDALVAQARAGVQVRLVLEESTDSAQSAAVSSLVAAGGEVVGYAYDRGGLYVHAKAIVADGARAYVGSENFSGGSLGYNRELGVIFDDEAAVATVAEAIAKDVEGGRPYSAD